MNATPSPSLSTGISKMLFPSDKTEKPWDQSSEERQMSFFSLKFNL